MNASNCHLNIKLRGSYNKLAIVIYAEQNDLAKREIASKFYEKLKRKLRGCSNFKLKKKRKTFQTLQAFHFTAKSAKAFSSTCAGEILDFLQGLETFPLEGLGINLQLNFLRIMFQLPLLDFIIFSNSCFMVKHSFSSSETLSFMLSNAKTGFGGVFPSIFLSRARFPLRFCVFSRFSEVKNQPATEVLSFSCSKNRTWTTTLSGSLSFWAAWVLASKDSFWQFMSLQICSFSESVIQG